MLLAGIHVSTELVRVLATIVDEPTASVLEHALDTGVVIVGLTIDDRQRIVSALKDPPAGLEELRDLLEREQMWRTRAGL
jgi:hypothetical protein